MNKNYYVVIMAGGIGSRFWPYSRNHKPKQFLDVLGTGNSLLQMTYFRFKGICPPENILIVTNEAYKDIVYSQLPNLKKDQVLLEPARRNTAPCIAYATYKIYAKNKDACVVVAPSDHAIFKEDEFERDILGALEAAKSGEKLVTLGIKPNRPETGYGYIQYIDGDEDKVKRVKTFTEKPHLELAQTFIDSGDFLWNSGIFVWCVGAIKKAFEHYLPEMAEIFEEGLHAYYTKDEKEFIQQTYAVCKNISIDYGIMEKAPNVYVVMSDFGWSDLSSWSSLHDIKAKDKAHNVVDGNVLLYDCKNSLIKGSNEKLIVVHGLEGYLVAECDNVILICKKDDEEKFKEFIRDLKNDKDKSYL